VVPDPKLTPNPDAALRFLSEITKGWDDLGEPVMIELRCLMPDRMPDISRFSPDKMGLELLIEHAFAMNSTGLNCYPVINPVRASAPMRRDGKLSGAMDEDIVAAFFFWADGDDEEAANSIRNFAGPKHTMAVMTGLVPSPRPHIYWRCEDGPIRNLDAWTGIQRSIAARLSTDRSVVNPSRIMRLPGTINWPTAKKAAKGRIPELTTFRNEYDDDRSPVTFDQMLRVFGGQTAEQPKKAFEFDDGLHSKSAADYSDILRRARTDGEKHTGVRDLAASLAGAGVPRALAEAMVREACPVWDHGVEKLIQSAYEKFTPSNRLAEKQQEEQVKSAEWPTAYDFFDETALAPRRWIYSKHYLRNFVSVMASAGGIGKTSLQIVEALAICTGRNLLGEPVVEPCNVWLVNLEDPIEEMQRRILAAMRHYGITPEDVRGKLFVDAGRDFVLNFATQTREGVVPNAALIAHLIAKIPERNIGAVFIDPFVGAHQVNENDNGAMNTVVAQIRRVADETSCAIGLVHHIRKGNGADADIDSVRGAGSLIGAARAARVINRISVDDAVKLGVKPDEALGIFRVDDGKANLAPPAAAAVYRRMHGVQIANGEWVGVATAFDLPDEWGGMSDRTVNDILSIIAMGIPDADGNEEYYSARPQDNERWVGSVIVNYAFDNPEDAKTEGQAKRIISQWFKSGLLKEVTYRSTKQRKDRKGVQVEGRVGDQR